VEFQHDLERPVTRTVVDQNNLEWLTQRLDGSHDATVELWQQRLFVIHRRHNRESRTLRVDDPLFARTCLRHRFNDCHTRKFS